VIEVVALAVRSPTPANTDKPLCALAMLLMSSIMFTVLPTPGAAEQDHLAALGERAYQVDHLDARFEQFLRRAQFVVGRGLAVDRRR
jgi:hypothetical protein